MEIIKLTKQEQEQITKNILVNTAVADIAINDLAFTLDDGVFFPWDSPFGPYSFDSDQTKNIQFNTFMIMSYHLCTLKGCGVDLSKQLAKKSGLLNYKLSDTITVTEGVIEVCLKDRLMCFIQDALEDSELEFINYYRQLFLDYCLKHMTEEQLKEQINSKIKSYGKNYTID